MSQLTSPQNEGLFQRAVVMSGVFTPLYPGNSMPLLDRTLRQAEAEGAAFFEFIGVSTLEEARKLDAVYIRDKMLEYGHFWGTVIDQVYCPGNPYDLFLKGQHHKVPVMLGNTSSEFMSAPGAGTMEEFRAMAVEMFGGEAEAYLKLCAVDTGSLEEMIQKASVNNIEYAARVAIKANSDSGSGVPMYYYNFDADIPGWDDPGTFHSVDLWFHFETLAKCWRPFVGKHYDLARQMCNYLAYFVGTGDPNGKDSTGEELPLWKPCTPETPYGMVFADQAVPMEEPPGEVMQFLVEQCFNRQAIHTERNER